MAESINCISCGASNQLPDGKTSMFCAFCGTSIQVPQSKFNDSASSIKTKPEISKRKVKVHTKKVEGDIGAMHWLGDYSTKRRVDGGFEIKNKNGSSWEFIPDEIKEEEEEVIKKGGELLLTNRGIKSLTEVIQWFSDSELKDVRILDLSNNKISNFDELQIFKNVEKVNLSNNTINKFPNSLKLKQLVSIDLNGNPIPSNYSFDNWRLLGGVEIIIENGLLIAKPEKVKCSICGCEIQKITYNRYDKQCKKCYEGAGKRRMDSILNDPILQKAFKIPESFEFKLQVFLGKAILVGVIILIIYSVFFS